MEQFPYVKPNAKSLAMRRPVFGVGTNDAPYMTTVKTDRGRVGCPYYITWHNMLKRCCSDAYKKAKPTYSDCVLSPEWVSFMAFRAWMEKQDWQGKQLDKDIIKPGNKIYGPEYCCFVSSALNKLLLDRRAKRGDYPQGVSRCPTTGKLVVIYSHGGKSHRLGYFDTPEAAHAAYVKRKREIIYEAAMQQTDERIKNGLLAHMEALA